MWGDPHYHTWDGPKFGFQGKPEHYLIKPRSSYKSLPSFYVTQGNRQWLQSRASSMDFVALYIPTWKLQIKLKAPATPAGQITLEVNGKPQNLPYTYEKIVQKYKKRYVKVLFTDSDKDTLVLVTSFGLKIWLHQVAADGSVYTNLALFVPQHPELQKGAFGLLGTPNGNPSDDFIDAKGTKHTPDSVWSWGWGNSWTVVQSEITPPAEQEKAKKEVKAHQEKTKQNPGKQKRIKKTCKLLEDPLVVNCAKKLGRPPPSAEDCELDASFSKDEAGENSLICGLLGEYNKLCSLRLKSSLQTVEWCQKYC